MPSIFEPAGNRRSRLAGTPACAIVRSMSSDAPTRRTTVLLLLAPSLLALLLGAGLYGWIASGLGALRSADSLGQAIEAGVNAAVLRLLAEGADPNGRFAFRHPELYGGQAFEATPLTIASAVGRDSIVHMILDAGARPDLPGNEQAVCAAVALSHGNVLRRLMQAGASVNPRPKCDGDRISPLGLARELGFREFVERLEAAGALADY